MSNVQEGVNVFMTIPWTNGSMIAQLAPQVPDHCMKLLELLEYRVNKKVFINDLLLSCFLIVVIIIVYIFLSDGDIINNIIIHL